MALQFSTTLRNDMMSTNSAITEVWNTVLGASATLQIYSGTEPANCAAVDTGTQLASLTLNASPFGVASAGAMTMNGLTISGTAGNTGTASYFRIKDGSSNCHVQGTVGTSGQDLIINNTSITSGQTVQLTGFTVTAPGA